MNEHLFCLKRCTRYCGHEEKKRQNSCHGGIHKIVQEADRKTVNYQGVFPLI